MTGRPSLPSQPTASPDLPGASAPPPPPPAEITYTGQLSVDPMAQMSFLRLCGRIPSVLARIARMSWAVDRAAVVLLGACLITTSLAAAGQLAATAEAMGPLLTGGTVRERLHAALPALIVVAVMAALARTTGALQAYGERRITPKLTTESDTALVASVCNVEAATYYENGFHDRQEAAEMGVLRTHVMVGDAQQLVASVVKLVTAGGVLSLIDPLLLPCLLLAVVPAGVGASPPVWTARSTSRTSPTATSAG